MTRSHNLLIITSSEANLSCTIDQSDRTNVGHFKEKPISFLEGLSRKISCG
jgi:hypothetical protein